MLVTPAHRSRSVALAVLLGLALTLPTQASAAPLAQAPAGFTVVAAAIGNASATLTWTAHPEATAYNVYAAQTVIAATASDSGASAHPLARATPGSWVAVAQGVRDTTTTLADLPPEGSYAFVVRAADRSGQERAQTEPAALSLADAPGDDLTLAVQSTGSLRLAWEVVPGAPRYAVLIGAPGRPLQRDPSRAALTDTMVQLDGLTPGSSWRFAVIAEDADGHVLARSPETEITVPLPWSVGGGSPGMPPAGPWAPLAPWPGGACVPGTC